MDSRERVFLALDHQEPDRVPRDFWASSGAWAVIAANTGIDREAFLDVHDIDFRYIDGPCYIGPPLPADTDIWGVKRRVVTIPTPFGDRMSFQGGISIQQTMPRGSAADVKAEVVDRVQTLALGGGYILCTAHNIQADCPISNILALMDAYRECATYR